MAAARNGATVKFVGAVGEDAFGDAALADLAAEDVDVSGVSRLSDSQTGVALIVVGERGENQIAVASGANARVDEALVIAALTGYEPTGVGVFLANFEVSDAAVLAAARLAAARGMTVLINPAPARQLPAELVHLRPILLPNEREAEALTGIGDPLAAASQLMTRTGAPVIVTLGEEGAVLVDAGGARRLPTPRVEVVDTTGAGDCLAGVLAAQMAAGKALREAAREAVRAASQSVTTPGARG